MPVETLPGVDLHAALERRHTVRFRLALIGSLVGAAGFATALLFVGIPGSVEFALTRRIPVVIAMVLVAAAGSVSTVVFHTITDNRILAPSIMGFESLFVLAQTCLVYFAGTGGLTAIPQFSPQKFLTETALMVLFATFLFRWLFSGRRTNLHVLLLIGVVFGVLFQSVTVFLQRMLAPNEFDILQARLLGGFTKAAPGLLPWAATGLLVTVGIVWARRHTLDVLGLGRAAAIGLGVDHRREVTLMLALISTMVAISTALVGPLTFFGFLAATLAYQIVGTTRHARTLPMAFAIGLFALTAGQFVLQNLAPVGALSILIEFVGGTVFLIVLFRKRTTA